MAYDSYDQEKILRYGVTDLLNRGDFKCGLFTANVFHFRAIWSGCGQLYFWRAERRLINEYITEVVVN